MGKHGMIGKQKGADAAAVAAQMAADMATFTHDPLGFAYYCWPWGTGDLEDVKGPREWQADVMNDLAAHLQNPKTVHMPFRGAVASGHGIGKSALLGMLIHWGMSTCDDCRVVLTANTEVQIRTKTWPEIRKWNRMAMNSDWFRCAATSIQSIDEKRAANWRTDAATWSENNTEAFAGLHNKGKRIILLFDEASSIADKVYEVAEGALTDKGTEIIWLAFGNPTRGSGRFRECFGKLKHRWNTRQIDSRTVEGTNKEYFDQLVQDYGENHDYVRVRVRGMFPMTGTLQLIPTDVVDRATTVEARSSVYDPLIFGVDVARFGDDETVICQRRGRDARTWEWVKFRGMDGMQVAARLVEMWDRLRPDAVFIDETGGFGGGPIDRLRQLGYSPISVNFGGRADSGDGSLYANKRAEMWCLMREWLKEGGAIPDDSELRQGLESQEFGYDNMSRILLEKKSDMKKRGLSSPDRADALALTFAHPVPAKDAMVRGNAVGHATMEWDPFVGVG